ncbi:hypothetical protein LAD12857_20790 [Lacrimispora amygdalina]|uniref:RiboL-PSP-HEPN domain-containing protein n=2 Tax=Lacrimispora amygdalina TaxID=253257 RepID=A0ABQ5M5G8_9FIRM
MDCEFCHVGCKEGKKSYKVADLSEFWKDQKNIVLCDPNTLAYPGHLELLWQLVDSKAKVNFNQGLDIRHKYLNKYEEIKEKCRDNDKDNYSLIANKFENYLKNYENDNMIEFLLLNITLSSKNRFRKPYVIIALSIIEQLFNDYFDKVIELNLSLSGSKAFLKAYKTSGSQACLNTINSFLNDELKCKMDKYVNGFYDRWKTFRELRNDIVHSNSKYISKITIKKIQKLISDGIEVFTNLNSEFYKK